MDRAVQADRVNGITPAQIAGLLGGQLTPSGKSAKIAALLKAGSFVISFKAPEAGIATVDWYELPAGGKLAKKVKPKPVLVATGQHTFLSAGTAQVAVKLSAAGKRLLKHARQLKLTAKGTFTPTGKGAVISTKAFVLKH